MIKQVWLMTNRNVIIFDEHEEQMHDLQRKISWDAHSYGEEEVLRKIVEDNPEVFLAKWQSWAHEITLDEFCSILGHGRWYYGQKKKVVEDGG